MERFFVVFPESSMRAAAMAMLDAEPVATRPYYSRQDDRLIIATLSDQEIAAAESEGVRIFVDVKFDHFAFWNPLEWRSPQARYWEQPAAAAPMMMAPAQVGLNEVIAHIHAPEAWEIARGGGVTIAVVDTGSCPTLQEIPFWKRSPLDIPSDYAGQHWNDVRGHGSMCAAIATATNSDGGKFNGVAPDATLISARSTLWATDVYKIYDNLTKWKVDGTIDGPLVVSNSYGLYRCSPPNVLPEDHPYMDIVLAAIDAGIVVVFAAGNNHHDVMCNHNADDCSPTTIWAVNSHDRILSVGTVNQQETNRDPNTPHCNSSRGPGEWASAYPKPDCVAPTYGEVVWGCGYRVMDWWGTSGACPQVAGLAALILSVDPSLSPQEVGDIIRNTARDIGAPHHCVGHGLIDCRAAVQEARP